MPLIRRLILPYEHIYKEETIKGSLERRERAIGGRVGENPGKDGVTGRGENLGARLGSVLTS